jgi:transcriptional regulator with XRE-family HTH domain
MSTISKNIRKLREQKGISQDRLSKLADISLNTIAKLELNETQNPTIETLQKIARALNVQVKNLIK